MKLEIGPGESPLLPPTPDVWYVDASQGIVSTLTRKGLMVSRGASPNLPFPCNSFELVVSSYFPFWKDPDSIPQHISEWLRVCRNGGCVRIITNTKQIKPHVPFEYEIETWMDHECLVLRNKPPIVEIVINPHIDVNILNTISNRTYPFKFTRTFERVDDLCMIIGEYDEKTQSHVPLSREFVSEHELATFVQELCLKSFPDWFRNRHLNTIDEAWAPVPKTIRIEAQSPRDADEIRLKMSTL